MLSKIAIHGSEGSYNSAILRALTDSSTHGLVGFFVWAFIENSPLFTDWSKWLNCTAAGVLASLVDVDHFLAAGSFNLKNALHLNKRPPFHNTSLVLVVALVFIILSRLRSKMWIFGLMFLSSWLTHHIRDANHRGLWLSPFGHTPLFSTQLYITCILILTVGLRMAFVLSRNSLRIFTCDNIVENEIV